ncbi:MAG TPA: VWA domain-containing protein [Terriglobales bacterium]|jgi:VWFA-related protein|nr:VWA domain-containing protein [Terriglobales bacterium]
MLSVTFDERGCDTPAVRNMLVVLVLALSVGLATIASAAAQDTSQQPPAPAPNPNQQDSPPAAGGPDSSAGPYAIPKKKEQPPEPPPERPKKIEGMPDYSINVDVPLVNLDVQVTTKDGQFIPGLNKENFKIFEDGTQQKVSNFAQSGDKPITAVLLVEFASTNYYFIVDALNASYAFANSLKKDDWIAVISYDMKPQILADFTQDKRAVYGALNQLRMPGFAETNMFDALFDTLDRLDRIEGKKYVILVSTGVDTFSKLTLDKILKKVKSTKDIAIYPISVGFAEREYYESHGRAAPHGMGIPVGQMDYLQADNEMKTFANLTGGRAYFPRFEGEMPGIFNEIAADLRNQYVLAYHPTNTKLDGTYRKLKVELQAPDGGPLKIRDQKGKDVKPLVYAREGYTAKHQVE